MNQPCKKLLCYLLTGGFFVIAATFLGHAVHAAGIVQGEVTAIEMWAPRQA
jgi:hypothetical protein